MIGLVEEIKYHEVESNGVFSVRIIGGYERSLGDLIHGVNMLPRPPESSENRSANATFGLLHRRAGHKVGLFDLFAAYIPKSVYLTYYPSHRLKVTIFQIRF